MTAQPKEYMKNDVGEKYYHRKADKVPDPGYYWDDKFCPGARGTETYFVNFPNSL